MMLKFFHRKILSGLLLLINLVQAQEQSGPDITSSLDVLVSSFNISLICPNNDIKNVVWITPGGLTISPNPDIANETCVISTKEEDGGDIDIQENKNEKFRFNPENGALEIIEVGWREKGVYKCYYFNNSLENNNENSNENVSYSRIEMSLDSGYRWHIYYFSLLYGFALAGGFLLLTLLIKLIFYLLEYYGCCLCCCCCENQLPPKARKIVVALDSIEAYKQHQLDKLKENYAQQSDWIRSNCANQMERVRDNYNYQVQNLKDIKFYGSTQIQAVREQYFEQMTRIREYSTSQLDKANENYIFQRQRLRKFNAQNYIRMRATGKYTQKTLNRVMENIPPLYLDLSNCRQGMGGRHESINYLADCRIEELEPFDPDGFDPICDGETSFRRNFRKSISGGRDIDQNSLYFTPEGTPIPNEMNFSHCDKMKKKKSSSLQSFHDDEDEDDDIEYLRSKRTKSWSNLGPRKWIISNSDDSASPKNATKQKKGDQQEQTVQVIVERVPTSADYLDFIDKSDSEEEEKVDNPQNKTENHQDSAVISIVVEMPKRKESEENAGKELDV